MIIDEPIAPTVAVSALTEITDVFEELKLKSPGMLEDGAVKPKLGSPYFLVMFDQGFRIGFALAIVRFDVAIVLNE